jgi:hypothetical protein
MRSKGDRRLSGARQMGITHGAFRDRTSSDTVAYFPPYAGLRCALVHALACSVVLLVFLSVVLILSLICRCALSSRVGAITSQMSFLEASETAAFT